ncbi:hypothetical protein [Methyloglobulus sp.]|uniref:hypothetical protein n=1 Tax=Methyloglobulus sp. TaxID=2518622 RepID=UPI0032B7DE53
MSPHHTPHFKKAIQSVAQMGRDGLQRPLGDVTLFLHDLFNLACAVYHGLDVK